MSDWSFHPISLGYYSYYRHRGSSNSVDSNSMDYGDVNFLVPK